MQCANGNKQIEKYRPTQAIIKLQFCMLKWAHYIPKNYRILHQTRSNGGHLFM